MILSLLLPSHTTNTNIINNQEKIPRNKHTKQSDKVMSSSFLLSWIKPAVTQIKPIMYIIR